MKNFTYIILMAAMVLLGSCTKDESFTDMQSGVTDKTIALTVGMPDQDVNSRIAYDANTRKLTWERGDQLLVVAETNTGQTKQVLNLVKGEGTQFGSFNCKEVAGATLYQIYYNSEHLKDASNGQKTVQKLDLSLQNQTAVNSTDHIKKFLHLSTEVVSEIFKTGNFSLKIQNAIMRLDLRSWPADLGNIREINWSCRDWTGPTLSLQNTPKQIIQSSSNHNYLYMCFNPSDIILYKDRVMQFNFIGSTNKRSVKKTITQDLYYMAGNEYSISISDKGKGGLMNEWTDKPYPKDNEIWITFGWTNQNTKRDKTGYTHTESVNESGYIVYTANNNQPITVYDTQFNYKAYQIFPVDKILLPRSIKTIPTGSFNESHTSEIDLSELVNLETIENKSFHTSLAYTIKLPLNGKLTTIGETTFSYCSNLSTFTVPKTVTSVGWEFLLCNSEQPALTSLYFLPYKNTTIAKWICNGYSEQVDLYINEDWINMTGESKPTRSGNTYSWNYSKWKSITLVKVNSDGSYTISRRL